MDGVRGGAIKDNNRVLGLNSGMDGDSFSQMILAANFVEPDNSLEQWKLKAKRPTVTPNPLVEDRQAHQATHLKISIGHN